MVSLHLLNIKIFLTNIVVIQWEYNYYPSIALIHIGPCQLIKHDSPNYHTSDSNPLKSPLSFMLLYLAYTTAQLS